MEKGKERQRKTTGENRQRRLARQRRGGVYALLAVLFVALLIAFCAGNLLHRDREYSEKENRLLAQRPRLTFSGITSGRFMEQYEEYQADQMIGRNIWVNIKTKADSVSGKKAENGVFNGKDGYLLEDIAVPQQEDLATNLSAMKAFAQAYPDVEMDMLLVPNAANILKNKLPALVVTEDQSLLIRGVKDTLGEDFEWIDAETVLKENRDQEIYYRTDHHWTTLGAYRVFENARQQLGIEAMETVPLTDCVVSDTFNGTLSAVSGYQPGDKETIHIYLPTGEDVPQVVVNYVEEQKKTASLYDSEKLKERDQYAVFLGGNHALVDIRSTRRDGERLLVIKDSYANCFIPFLALYYREIAVVDPRYYTEDLSRLMEEKEIDRVLFLYNANTFFEDRMLSGVLESSPDAGERADEG